MPKYSLDDMRYMTWLRRAAWGTLTSWRQLPDALVDGWDALKKLGFILVLIVLPLAVVIAPVIAYYARREALRRNAHIDKEIERVRSSYFSNAQRVDTYGDR